MSPARRGPRLSQAERREQLVQAALEVMAREGAWALTTRAVAAQAGVPHGTVHYAFSSKDALIRAVLDADVEHASRIFSPAQAADGENAEQTLTRVLDAYTDRLLQDPDTERVLQELTILGAREEALREAVAESTAQYRAMVHALLEAIAKRDALHWDAPLPLLTEQLLALVFGATLSWLVERDDVLLREALRDAGRSLAGRLRPPGSCAGDPGRV